MRRVVEGDEGEERREGIREWLLLLLLLGLWWCHFGIGREKRVFGLLEVDVVWSDSSV